MAKRLARLSIQRRYVRPVWRLTLVRARAVRGSALAALTTGLLVAAIAGSAHGQSTPPRSLQTGFFDTSAFTSPAATVWLGRAIASGATVVRIGESWSTLAPTRPASPVNPADPAYNWTTLDLEVERAAAAGLIPVVDVTSAPRWAEP